MITPQASFSRPYKCIYPFFLFFIILAGTPTTTALSGIFSVTTAPAPMVTLLPIFISGNIVAFAPIWVLFPIFTLPKIFAAGVLFHKNLLILTIVSND